MFWKKWPYWLRGGVIAILIPLISLGVLFLMSLAPDSHSGAPETPWNGPPPLSSVDIMGTMAMPVSFVWVFWGNDINLKNYLLLLILGWMLWFLIGSIIGLIYGKIKNRNKV